MGNISLQLVAQHCCFASCKALLPVLPPLQATCRATNFSVASCSNILHEVELGSTFGNMLLQQVACGGGNTGNKALQLAQQQCCATSCTKMLPVLLGLYLWMEVSCYVCHRIYSLEQCSRGKSRVISEVKEVKPSTKTKKKAIHT